MKTNKKPRARRAGARALRGQLIEEWFQQKSLHAAMQTLCISWQTIQAWKRWDKEFWKEFESTRQFLEELRKQEHREILFQRIMNGSDRATELYCRLYGSFMGPAFKSE